MASIKKMQQNGQANPNICHAGHSSLWAHSKWFVPKSLPFIYAGCERCHNLSNKYDPLILIKLPTDGYFRWGMAHPHLKCCCAILISELKSISKEQMRITMLILFIYFNCLDGCIPELGSNDLKACKVYLFSFPRMGGDRRAIISD